MVSSKSPRRPKAAPRAAKLALARLRLAAIEQAERAADDAPPPWQPDPGPQSFAAASPADVIGYGGAAGGGKTDLIVGLASTEHSKSIIFRREYPQIKDIIRRAKEITEGLRVAFNGQTGMLTLPAGKTIEFGAMKDPDDWEKYKGRPHDLKAYDEATEFLESQVRSSMAWLRTTTEGQRCRVVMTFNPPTNEEGMWIVRFFGPWLDDRHPDPAQPGELRWYATIDGEEVPRPDGAEFEHEGELIKPTSRTFFPARLADNPRLMKTGYGRTLQALPEPLRSQLLKGDFKAGIGVDPWLVIPPAWVDAAQGRWVALYGDGAGLGPMDCLGVDVAHGGKDKTVLAPRHGNAIGRLLKYAGKDTPDGKSAAGFVAAALEPDAYANVDVIGVGSSCYERLIDDPPEGHGLPANPINFSCGSDHTDRSGKYKMYNLRAEAYWRIREELDPENGTGLALPPDPELKADLCAAKYEIRPGGKIKIEEKADIAARLGRSPDCGDAVALTMVNGPPLPIAVGGPIAALAKQPDMRPAAPAFDIPGSLI